MKGKFWLLTLLPLQFFLMSATSIKVVPGMVKEEVVVAPAAAVKEPKLNFFEKIIFKMVSKKFKKLADTERADMQAKTALSLGLASTGTLLLGLFVPYLILASLPLGIAAIIVGGGALRSGTQYEGKARTGKGLGLGSVIAFGAILLIALIALASWDWN